MGVQIEQLKTSDFVLFLKKQNKTETTFFQVIPHFWGFFFFYVIKNPEISLE